jgi:hypothetical protein
MNKSKTGHILYLMVHFPFLWWWKIGITGKTAKGRAKQVDRAVFGWPVVVMVVPIPGAYLIEQDLHRRFAFLNCRYYRGDGSTEWFWFPVAALVLPFMLAVWLAYIYLADLLLGTRICEFIISLFL